MQFEQSDLAQFLIYGKKYMLQDFSVEQCLYHRTSTCAVQLLGLPKSGLVSGGVLY